MDYRRMIKFGSVFSKDDDDFLYVYICSANNSIYAAKILDKHMSKSMLSRARLKSSTSPQSLDTLTFCFVVLRDTSYKDQVAHLAPATTPLKKGKILYVCDLCEEDIKQLYDEVMSDLMLDVVRDAVKDTVQIK